MERSPLALGAANMWDSIWTDRQGNDDDWDYLSEVVFQVLKDEIREFKNKDIIETGSGSGRISLKMAELSANVSLLDYSTAALDMSRRHFRDKGIKANFIQADILDAPLEDSRYDVVWNAGVMEHFSYDVQLKVLSKLLRSVKKEGMLITLNPSSRSVIYKFGKALLMILRRWPFGKEYPIRSMRDIYGDIDVEFCLKEYPIGFIVFFIDLYKFLPKRIQQLKIIDKISELFIRSAKGLAGVDKFLSRIFGGYLIVSVVKKK